MSLVLQEGAGGRLSFLSGVFSGEGGCSGSDMMPQVLRKGNARAAGMCNEMGRRSSYKKSDFRDWVE
jgi:hypothetical protein